MGREFFEPRGGDVVAVIPNGQVGSLPSLAGAGIDTTAPFLVWADRLTGTLFARQSDEHREGDRARWFSGARTITGTAGEDPVDAEEEYERGKKAGEETAQDDAWQEGRAEGHKDGFAEGLKAPRVPAA